MIATSRELTAPELTFKDYIAPTVTTVVAAVAIAFFASSIPLSAIVGLATFCGHITIVSKNKQLAELSTKAENLDSKNQQLQEQIKTLTQQKNTIETLVSYCATLCSDPSALKPYTLPNDPYPLIDQIENLHNNIKSLNKEIENLKNQVQIQTDTQELNNLRRRNSELTEQVEELQEKIEESKELCKNAIDIDETFPNITHYIRQLTKEIERLKTRQTLNEPTSTGIPFNEYLDTLIQIRAEYKALDETYRHFLSACTLQQIRDNYKNWDKPLNDEQFQIVTFVHTAFPELISRTNYNHPYEYDEHHYPTQARPPRMGETQQTIQLAEEATQQSALAASSEGPDLKQFTEMANRLRNEFTKLNDENNNTLSDCSLDEIREFMTREKLLLTEDEYNSIVVPVREALPDFVATLVCTDRIRTDDNPLNDECLEKQGPSQPRTMALPSSPSSDEEDEEDDEG